jgi:hypothetical protein
MHATDRHPVLSDLWVGTFSILARYHVNFCMATVPQPGNGVFMDGVHTVRGRPVFTCVMGITLLASRRHRSKCLADVDRSNVAIP